MEIDKVKVQLSSKLEIKDLDRVRKILGMDIVRDMNKGRLYLMQRQYLEKAVARFGMENAKSVSSLLTPHFKLLATMAPNLEEDMEYMV